MATAKEKREQSRALCFMVGLIIMIPLLVVSLATYSALKNRYPENERSQRIFDIGNLTQPFITASIVVILSYIIIAWTSALYLAYFIAAPVVIFAAFTLFKVAQSISSTYFGVVVDPEGDRVLFPKDMANYSISDYFGLKFVTELGTLEEVPLTQIQRITRQGGRKLFVHGKFGSRGMQFSNKQKRDECLSAIQEGSSAALSVEFEGA